MNKKIIIIIAVCLALVLAVIAGIYGFGIYQEHQTATYEAETKVKLIDSLNNGEADAVASLIYGVEVRLKDKHNLQGLEQLVLDSFAEYSNGLDYSKFEMMDAVINALTGSDNQGVKALNSKLKKLLDSSQKNRFLAALQGYWYRDDMSLLSGSVVEVKTALAIYVYVPDNVYGFAEGDIKWKDIQVIGDNQYSLKDLFRGETKTSYDESTAILSPEGDSMSIKSVGSVLNETSGSDQKWIKISKEQFEKLKTSGEDDKEKLTWKQMLGEYQMLSYASTKITLYTDAASIAPFTFEFSDSGEKPIYYPMKYIGNNTFVTTTPGSDLKLTFDRFEADIPVVTVSGISSMEGTYMMSEKF